MKRGDFFFCPENKLVRFLGNEMQNYNHRGGNIFEMITYKNKGWEYKFLPSHLKDKASPTSKFLFMNHNILRKIDIKLKEEPMESKKDTFRERHGYILIFRLDLYVDEGKMTDEEAEELAEKVNLYLDSPDKEMNELGLTLIEEKIKCLR